MWLPKVQASSMSRSSSSSASSTACWMRSDPSSRSSARAEPDSVVASTLRKEEKLPGRLNQGTSLPAHWAGEAAASLASHQGPPAAGSQDDRDQARLSGLQRLASEGGCWHGRPLAWAAEVWARLWVTPPAAWGAPVLAPTASVRESADLCTLLGISWRPLLRLRCREARFLLRLQKLWEWVTGRGSGGLFCSNPTQQKWWTRQAGTAVVAAQQSPPHSKAPQAASELRGSSEAQIAQSAHVCRQLRAHSRLHRASAATAMGFTCAHSWQAPRWSCARRLRGARPWPGRPPLWTPHRQSPATRPGRWQMSAGCAMRSCTWCARAARQQALMHRSSRLAACMSSTVHGLP